jgi:hypothetical protein
MFLFDVLDSLFFVLIQFPCKSSIFTVPVDNRDQDCFKIRTVASCAQLQRRAFQVLGHYPARSAVNVRQSVLFALFYLISPVLVPTNPVTLELISSDSLLTTGTLVECLLLECTAAVQFPSVSIPVCFSRQ